MKKIFLNISILLAAVCTVSCSLDTESMTSITTQNFYKTMNDAKSALVGCYAGYRMTSAYSTMSFYELSELMGDDAFGGTGATDARGYQVIDRFDQSESPSDLSATESLWSNYYAGIFDCNSLLAQLDNIEWEASSDFNTSTPEQTRAAVEGEARFLRALLYFELVRLYGNVPLLTVPTTEIVPQSAPEKVFELIFEDLQFAIDNIKYVADKSWYEANDGRATKQAAEAILARAYLFYKGYYSTLECPVDKEDVVAGLEDIVSCGYYGLVQEDVHNGAARLWRSAVATDAGDGNGLNDNDWVGIACSKADVNEFIFTQKFNYYGNEYSGQHFSNRWLIMRGIRGAMGGDPSIVPYGGGWGGCTANPDSYKIFASNDPRRDVAIQNWNTSRQAAITKTMLKDWREFTYYSLAKYIPLSVNVGGISAYEVTNNSDFGSVTGFQESQYQDVIVVRYADVLLMLSELTGDYSYANQVCDRAGVAHISTYEELLEERHREFLGEGIRYWDLLRQGVEYAADAIAGSWTVLSGGVEETLTISRENIIAKKGLCRIPDNQIDLSGKVYVQNTGW